MRKFELSQKHESRDQSSDSSKAYRKSRAFICLTEVVKKHENNKITFLNLFCYK